MRYSQISRRYRKGNEIKQATSSESTIWKIYCLCLKFQYKWHDISSKAVCISLRLPVTGEIFWMLSHTLILDSIFIWKRTIKKWSTKSNSDINSDINFQDVEKRIALIRDVTFTIIALRGNKLYRNNYLN